MSNYKDNGIKLTLFNTKIQPDIRHYEIVKDLNNILRIPIRIDGWLDSDSASKDYTNKCKVYTENNVSTITLYIDNSINVTKHIIVHIVYNPNKKESKSIDSTINVINNRQGRNKLVLLITRLIHSILDFNNSENLEDIPIWFSIDK